jgi:simple sugar transport system ATP-binding protein
MTSDRDPADTEPPAIECREISKAFGSVQALDSVNLVLRRGAVHALVGENGSGKSTLMKIIAGAHAPDSGQIIVNGTEIADITPRDALNSGVRVIYQDLALFPNMTVAENIAFEGGNPPLSKAPGKRAILPASAALARLGANIAPSTRLGDLSTAERQLVAIARAISSDGEIILMDEPTAALTQDEIDSLLASVRTLAASGVSFIFISHKLREVVDIADDVSVIRDGRLIATGPASEFDTDRISFLMTGNQVVNVRRTEVAAADGEPALRAVGLSLGTTFQQVDLELYPGRIYGLSGLVGCGKNSIGLAIAGLIPTEPGRLVLHGKPIRSARRHREIQYVPDDRLTEGLFLDWSIAENVVASSLAETQNRAHLLSSVRQKSLAEDWQRRLSIKTPTIASPVSSLSGGNQQRVLLAKALAPRPSVMIFNNPTVGVDVGSRAAIHDLIRAIANDGTAVLLISDEPAELLATSDDVGFVVAGRLRETHPADELTEERIIDINQSEVVA